MRLATPQLAVLAACAPSCAPAAPERPPPDALDALGAPVFEARVATRIAELERRVDERDERDEARNDVDDGEVVELVEMFRSSGPEYRDLALDDIGAIGPAALPKLLELARDDAREPEERNAALHLVLGVGTPAALEAIVEVLESAAEPWRRRYAAWLLGQSDDDRFVLRMLLPLRYEKDGETVCWLAEALARHGNYAGLDGLATLVELGGGSAELARGKAAQLVAECGLEVEDATALRALWNSARAHDVLDGEPSDALRLAAWRELAELSSERFQLRGVDDARFVLSRTGPWGARLVASALVDEDAYVRLHAAQVLERMGARARPVARALHPLLLDPRTAHAVAEALGAIAAPESLPLLLAALLDRRPYELRVAAARGLGRFGDASATPALRAVVDDAATPDDLRLAAAAALALCGDGRAVAPLLADGMTNPDGDPLGCESALARWIEHEAGARTDGTFEELLEAWRELDGPPALLRTPEDTRARLAARAALVHATLSKETTK